MGDAPMSWIAINKSGEISLDSDLTPLPRGWERCLDLQSGVMYLKQMNSQQGASNRDASHSQKRQRIRLSGDEGEGDPALQLTLSLPSSLQTTPPWTASPHTSAAHASSTQSNQSSLCSAKSPINNVGLNFLAVPNTEDTASFNGSSPCSQSAISSSSSSSSPSQQNQLGCQSVTMGLRGANQVGSQEKAVFKATGCPHCFMYVLPSKSNPKCPRCKSSILVDLSPLTIQ